MELETPQPDAPATTPRAWQSVLGLQRELREIFECDSPRRAAQLALAHVAAFFDAVYIAMHARLGIQLLSEEWAREGFEPSEELRDITNNTLLEAILSATAKCVRLGRDGEIANGVLASVLFDEHLEGTGGAVIVLGPTSRMAAVEALSIFEGVVGYIGLLIASKTTAPPSALASPPPAIPPAGADADHPLHLAIGIATRLKNTHGFDQAAVGYVRKKRVKVVAISGFDEIRASNPGVKLIRQAMEECLDRRETILDHGHISPADGEDDCRLHAQWSLRVGGDSVASFPIMLDGTVVAVCSVQRSAPDGITRARLDAVAQEMAAYAPLIPLSRMTSRSLSRHACETLSGFTGKLFRRRGTRATVGILTALILGLWLLLGTVTYDITAPGRVVGAGLRTVSCPWDGILTEVLVKPGDIVGKGDVLAVLDARDWELRAHEITAKLATNEALADQALAENRASEARVNMARIRSARAELELVRVRIAQAKIRAKSAGIVLEGDLRQRVGAWLHVGENLFALADNDRVIVEIEVPEKRVAGARSCKSAVFVSAALPDERIDLMSFVVPPASTVVDQRNVFVARSVAVAKPARISPGMAGFVHLELGKKRVWWVATHRIVDWLRLRFWL